MGGRTMAGKAVRDPAEQALEDAFAIVIGYCPCGGKLAVTGARTDKGLDYFYRCQDCRRRFERGEASHAS